MSGTQWPNRPDWNNRPGQGMSGTQWPNRPGWDNNRPGWANNRPGWWNNNNRPDWNNRPNWINRPDNSTNINVNQNNWNQINNNQFVSNRQFGGGYGGYFGWNGGIYGGAWSTGLTNWYQGSWANYGFGALPWWGASNAAALGWLAGAGTAAYSNPYYVAPSTTVVQPVYNYSEPIPVPADTTAYAAPAATDTTLADTTAAPTTTPPPAVEPQQAPPDPKEKEALETFAAARDAFKAGDYAQAQQKIEKAIGLVPSDPIMHEFRSLTLFAQGKYQEAAATIYAVLARGPGWDWDTLKSLYADPATYTAQLRALEAFAKDHPKDAASRFLLAYHYLTLRQPESAVRMLQDVTRLAPDDQLAAQMLKALTAPKEAAAGDAPKAG
jgi:tetratricopeptide (TPR) repeat protein